MSNLVEHVTIHLLSIKNALTFVQCSWKMYKMELDGKGYSPCCWFLCCRSSGCCRGRAKTYHNIIISAFHLNQLIIPSLSGIKENTWNSWNITYMKILHYELMCLMFLMCYFICPHSFSFFVEHSETVAWYKKDYGT